MTEPFELTQWVIYDRPRDYPSHFVVRRWSIIRGGIAVGPEVWLRDDLLGARLVVDAVAPGTVRLPRDSSDDPAIVEVWM